MAVYLRGQTYWVEFQILGQRIRQSAGTTNKRQAQTYERELREQIADELHNSRSGHHFNKTYADALLKWIETGAPESMMGHARITRGYLDDVRLVDVPAAAQEMKTDMLKEGLSKLTINRRLAVVRRILNLAYREWDWIREPLGQKIRLFSEKGTARELYLSPEEVVSLVEAIKCGECKKIVMLAAYTGLRRSEVLHLQPDQWDGQRIRIYAKRAKAKKPRIVPVIPTMRELVTPPFKTTPALLRNEFEAAREKIGRPEIWFHDLRHTFASWLAKNPEIPLAVIRDLLGHSSLSVTSKYAHLRDDHDAILEQALSIKLPET